MIRIVGVVPTADTRTHTASTASDSAGFLATQMDATNKFAGFVVALPQPLQADRVLEYRVGGRGRQITRPLS